MYLTAILSALLIALPIALAYLFAGKKRKARAAHLKQFQSLAGEHQLVLTCQELLPHTIMGVDGIQRKLLIWSTDQRQPAPVLIDLAEVKCCTRKKVYRQGPDGATRARWYPDGPEIVVLRFEFTTHREPVDICFYHQGHDPLPALRQLEQKAGDWETMLNKMLPASHNRKRQNKGPDLIPPIQPHKHP